MPDSQLLPSVLLPEWDKLFVARSDELDLILRHIDSAVEGPTTPPVLAFCGVSGIGKTALCSNAHARMTPEVRRKTGICSLDFDSPRYYSAYPLFELFGKALYPALRAAGFRCPLFLVMYTTWAARLNEQSAISQSTLFKDLLDQGKDTSEALEEKDALFKADWLEVFGEAAEGFGTAKLLLKGATYLKASRQRNRFAERFADIDLATIAPAALDPLAPKALAADIIHQLQERHSQLTLFIDGFDRLQSESKEHNAEWAIQQLLANLLLSPVGRAVRCVVFSRTPIAWAKYDAAGSSSGWPELIEQRDLLGLQQAAAETFVSRVEVWYDQCEAPEGQAIAKLLRQHRRDILAGCRESDESATVHALALTVAVEQVARHHDNFTIDLLGRSASDMYDRFLRGLTAPERDLLEVFSIFGEFSEKQFAAALRVGLLPGVGSHHFQRVVGERRYCISHVDGDCYRVHSQLVRSMRSWCMGDAQRKASYFRACHLLLEDLLKAINEVAQTSYTRAEEYLISYLVVLQNYAMDLSGHNADWYQALAEIDMHAPAWLGLELRIKAYLEHANANQADIECGAGSFGHFVAGITRAAELMYGIGDYEHCLSTVEFALDEVFEPDATPKTIVEATLRLHQGASLIRTARVPEGEAILASLVSTRTDWFELSFEGLRMASKLAGSLGEFQPERGLEFIDWLVTSQGEACKRQFDLELRNFLAVVETPLALKINDLKRASKVLSNAFPDSEASGAWIDPITDANILMQKAGIALAQGNRESAIAMARNAVRSANRIEGAREQSKSQILADAGTVLRDANAADDWLQILRESLSLYEASDGPESHLCVPVRTALAHGLIAQGTPTEAVSLLRKNVEIVERDLDDDHKEVITALINLANAIMEAGEDEQEARTLFERAFTAVMANPDASDFDRGIALANWGANALERYQFDEAKSHLTKAVNLLRTIEGFAEGHLPKALYNLAEILHMKGDVVGALKLLTEAGTFVKRYRGEDAPELSYINSMALAIVQGRMRP